MLGSRPDDGLTSWLLSFSEDPALPTWHVDSLFQSQWRFRDFLLTSTSGYSWDRPAPPTLTSSHLAVATPFSLVSYQHQLSHSLQHAFKLAASGRMRSRSLSQNISLYFRISNTFNIPKPMPFFFHWPIASVHWCQGTSNLGALLPALSKATDLYTSAFPTTKDAQSATYAKVSWDHHIILNSSSLDCF